MKKLSRFETPEQSPGFLLWQVSTKWRKEIEAVLATLGLTHPQFVLLAGVGWYTQNGNKVTQAELARHCATDITMTSQVLRTLEKKGLIKRRQYDGDERSKFPHLTKLGTALIKQAFPLVEEVDQKFFQENAKKSVELLKRLI